MFIGSGITCYLLAQQIKVEDQLSVITNNVSIVQELKDKTRNLILIGGEISCHESLLFTSSEKVSQYFNSIFVNKAFTSATAIDFKGEITVTRELSTFIYKELPKITNRWFLMAEFSKFEHVAMYQVAKITGPDCYVIDKIPEKYEKYLIEQGKELIFA
ncbi:MAG: hypothetical protein MJB14_23710 [Spirochaetes bacterium]|nr:hypothetical protein [Spirochaetota bacterium]